MVDFFLKWWLKSGRYGWSKARRLLFERKYLKNPLPQANSLDEIAGCLREIHWTMDGPLHLYDSISYPETTWTTKKDDCDGFSIVAAALLNRLDRAYRPVLVTAVVRPVAASHTVCVFREPAGFRFFNNDTLDAVVYDSYRGVVNKINGQGQRLVCWDVREPDSLKLVEFNEG